MYSFITSGSFIIFKYTEDVTFSYTAEQAPLYEHEVFKLRNTSTSIDWSLPEDTTKITFTINEQTYENVPLSSIEFDDIVCTTQASFISGVQGMFENLAAPGEGGGTSYLVYNARLSGGIEENPVVVTFGTGISGTWVRHGIGDYRCLTSTPFDVSKIFMQNVVVEVDVSVPGEESINGGRMPIIIGQDTVPSGYYRFFAVNNGGFLEMQFDTFDADGEYIDMGIFDPPIMFYLPEIRVYP